MEEQERYTAFISYAVEDKEEVVEPIVNYLERRGIKVYFAGDDLRPGDTIADVINEAMCCSTYAIFVLSPHCDRHWPAIEHFHFRQKEKKEERELIFPVWHNISYAEVQEMFPWISERYAVSTNKGIDRAAAKLYKAIRRRLRENKRRKRFTWLKRIAAALVITGIILSVMRFLPDRIAIVNYPSRQFLEALIEKRITAHESSVGNTIQETVNLAGGKRIAPDSVTNIYARFLKLGTHKRNTYKFVNDYITLTSRKKILEYGLPADETPYTFYSITAPRSYLLEHLDTDTVFTCAFLLVNPQPLQFNLDTILYSGEEVCVHVSYREPIRAAQCRLQATRQERIRMQHLLIMGFSPCEEYVFKIRGGLWDLSLVR